MYKEMMNNEVGVRVNGNEGVKNIDENIIDEIIEVVKKNKFNRYPDSNSSKLREAYSKLINISSENIIAGNGSDEMISLIINTFIKKNCSVLTLKPDFTMYDFYTDINEGIIKKYETEEDGSFSVNKFIDFAKEIRPKIVILSNPNNPTGYVLKNEEIEMILDALEDSIVVIDEAYYEFYGKTMISYINKYKNLIVTRTLSKAWGLASLRVGFLIANQNLVKKLNNYKEPYNLNQLSQDMASIVLNNPEAILKNIEEIINERERMYVDLKDIEKKAVYNIKFYESKGNFIFGRSEIKEKLREAMEFNRISIRYFDDNSFRISIGSPEENDLIINTIKDTFIGREEFNEG